MFKRSWDEKEGKSKVISQNIGLNDDAISEILKKNVSALSASRAFQNDTLKGIHDYFDKHITNVMRSGRISWGEESIERLKAVGDVYQKDEELFQEVKKFLASIDLGISDVELRPLQESNSAKKKVSVVPYALHDVAGKKYELHFIYESSGTKSIFVLMEKIFTVLRNGGIAVIDECEAHLHPQILSKIVDLFINPGTNPRGSQLIFSTHSLEMFTFLEKEQIFLVEKSKETLESEVYRLDQIPGIRRDDNLYAKYMAGKFGAIPNI
jgi:predicted ATP-dependent endonuclease of OLD family